MDVEATTVRIQAAEGNNNEDFEPCGCIISAVDEVLSASSVNRSQVLKNMVTDSNGEETETTLPIAPESFRGWLLFDCKSEMSPEALCNVVQDLETTDTAVGLLVGCIRSKIIQATPRGGEDAPAAYPWHAAAAITGSLHVLPDPELQALVSRFDPDEVLGAPDVVVHAWMLARTGAGVLDLSGFCNRMRGDALTWSQAFARLWSEAASAQPPITCIRMPEMNRISLTEADRLHHCMHTPLPSVTALHLSSQCGPIMLWLELLPNLQLIQSPTLSASSRVEFDVVLPLPYTSAQDVKDGIIPPPRMSALIQHMPLQSLHFDCVISSGEMLDRLYEAVAVSTRLTSLKLPLVPTMNFFLFRHNTLSGLSTLKELSCPICTASEGIPESISLVVDSITHMASLSKLTLKDSEGSCFGNHTTGMHISLLLEAICRTCSKLPSLNSLHLEMSYASLDPKAFHSIERGLLETFQHTIAALDELTVQESPTFYNSSHLLPLLKHLGDFSTLRRFSLYDMPSPWSEANLDSAHWHALRHLSRLTSLQLTFNSLLPYYCACGLAEALTCMRHMRELDIDLESFWSSSSANHRNTPSCTDPTIIPQIAAMEHLRSLRMHVLQPMHDPGWALALGAVTAVSDIKDTPTPVPSGSSLKALPMATSLTKLDLRGVADKDASYLAAALQQMTCMCDLALGNTAFFNTDELGFLTCMRSLKALQLELHMHTIVDVDLGRIGSMLSGLAKLSSLELRCSYLDCVGAEQLGKQLRKLHALENLELRHLCSDDFEGAWPEVLGLKVPIRVLKEHVH